jgi:5-formyltetrahydrofolate cyclo-ligase
MPSISSSIGKPALRDAALARRDALPPLARSKGAQAMAAHSLPFLVGPGTIVAGYQPIRSAIDPRPLMQRLQEAGATLALPVIVGRDVPLLFRAWTFGAPLTRGLLGISEPDANAEPCVPDIVLTPLAAFDRAGHRIGYGGGYYDRTLEALRARRPTTAVGVAFAAQEVETIPASPHDATLDVVLTDAEAIDFRPDGVRAAASRSL